MVGLPARGKSYIARKIARYLKWIGVSTMLFNVGNYRRERVGVAQPHEFFSPNNEEGNRIRFKMALAALDDMLNWFSNGGKVAIYDATNSTRERRKILLCRCTEENVQVVFIESICNDESIIEKNVRETKLSSPDYKDKDPEKAVEDFRKRILEYEKCYEPLDSEYDKNLSYVKLIDVGKCIIINKIESYLSSRVIHFLMNLHITVRPIWLTRHGESEFNVDDRIGGDSPLTLKGDQYAQALADWVEQNSYKESLYVWTSTLKRAIGTAQYINRPKIQLKPLDEIDAGICDSMTYNQIAEVMPEEYSARASNKLTYRYPHGESYMDVIQRLEPILFELERQKRPILIVAHQAVLRALYAYFMDIEMSFYTNSNAYCI
jgi:broad specificity phosphatase PhoE/predicted kinase